MDEEDEGSKFCEEDIDQILQRRTKTITIESEGRGSTFAKVQKQRVVLEQCRTVNVIKCCNDYVFCCCYIYFYLMCMLGIFLGFLDLCVYINMCTWQNQICMYRSSKCQEHA